MKDTSAANLLLSLLGIAAIALITVVWWYVHNFGPAPSGSQEIWGQFGDFLGGTLNPILGFLSLVAIVMTLAVQSRQLDLSHEQLKLSRSELEASREELRKSAEAQQNTAEALKHQARFTALSARISAISSAISAIDQQLNRQASDLESGPFAGVAAVLDSTGLRARRKALEQKLQNLVQEAESA
jgi:hypothetical protein